MDLVEGAIHVRATGNYDVCSGFAYPIRHYYANVCDAVGIYPAVYSSVEEIPKPADDVDQMEFDPNPAWETFRWRATTMLEDGVRKTVASYDVNGVGETYTHLRLAA